MNLNANELNFYEVDFPEIPLTGSSLQFREICHGRTDTFAQTMSENLRQRHLL